MIKFSINLILKFFNLKIQRFCTLKNPNLVIINYKKNKIIKIKFGKNRNFFIKNEINGFKWYYKKIKSINSIKPYNFCFFSGLEVEIIKGKKINYFSRFSENLVHIKNFIKYYDKIWTKNNKQLPAHGDLTFDNIIITNKSFEIIDWEFFKKSGEDYCFDLVYFFLSTLILPSLKYNGLNKKELKSIIKIWKLLKKRIKNKKLKQKPIQFYKDKFKKDTHWFKISSTYPEKLFLEKLGKSKLIYFETILK